MIEKKPKLFSPLDFCCRNFLKTLTVYLWSLECDLESHQHLMFNIWYQVYQHLKTNYNMFCPSADCWKKYLSQGPESQGGKEIIYNDNIPLWWKIENLGRVVNLLNIKMPLNSSVNEHMDGRITGKCALHWQKQAGELWDRAQHQTCQQRVLLLHLCTAPEGGTARGQQGTFGDEQSDWRLSCR